MSTATAPAPVPASTKSSASSAPNKGDWKGEIHTPEQTYNANVPVDLIERDPGNRTPAQADIERRAAEIEAEGLLQPIVLRQLDTGKYRIIAGETRWLAFKFLERATIPAFIRKGEDVAGDVAKRLIENLGRTDLPPIDKARGFRDLIKAGRTQKEVGALFNLSQPVVGNAVRMLALPEAVLEAINTGKMPEAHGVSLARFADWPKAVTVMAEYVGHYGWSAKNLNDHPLPFTSELLRRDLVAEIRTKAHWSYGEDTHPVYKITDEIRKSADFVACRDGSDVSYYIYPEDKTKDVWTPEKKKQDEARATKTAEETKKHAAAIKSGKLTKEQIDRKKKIEANKKVRAETAASLEIAYDKLRRTPAPTTLLVAIITETVIAGGYGAKRIEAAAAAVGVTLPKGLASETGGHGMRDVELMLKMDVMDLTRVVVAVLLGREVDDANKNATGLPDNVELVMNSKVPAAEKAPASSVLIDVPATKKVQYPKRIKITKAGKKGGKK